MPQITEREYKALNDFIDWMDEVVFEEHETKELRENAFDKAMHNYIELRKAMAEGSLGRLREAIQTFMPELIPKLGELMVIKSNYSAFTE